jgi:hypothetical protein
MRKQMHQAEEKRREEKRREEKRRNKVGKQ